MRPTESVQRSANTDASRDSGHEPARAEPAGSRAHVQMKAALAGKDFATQAAMLAPNVQAKGNAEGQVHAAAAQGIASGGGAMPHMSAIQQAFGRHDVSAVQAHVGGAAKQASQAMGAEAYASGNHVAFGDSPDLHTAAHEAAHVVQQRAGVSLSGGVGKAGDGYERHADAVAGAVVQGKSAEGLLDEMAGGGAQAVQKRDAPVQMTTVSNQIKDGKYGWLSSYDVDFDDKKKECQIVVKVKLSPKDSTVTEDDVKGMKAKAGTQFAKYWDGKFSVTDRASGTKYTLRTALSFVDTGEHVAVTLHPGSGRDNRRNWYVTQIDDITLAHELGHQLGLKDEYIDPDVPDRADATKPGAHQDHSIMGDYYSEGEDKATAKGRHGEVFAGHIGAATGRTLDSSVN